MYIPILKTKQAELDALNELSIDERLAINPIFVIVPKKHTVDIEGSKRLVFKSNSELLDELLIFIDENFIGSKVFIDGSIVYSESREAFLKDLLASKPTENIIPVLKLPDLIKGFTLTNEEQNKVNELGFCLRISLDEFQKGYSSISEYLPFSTDLIDLVVDLSVIDETKMKDFISKLDSDVFKQDWRSITLASGSFPKDLTGLESGKDHLFRRYEWQTWKIIRAQQEYGFVSKINFGDYAVQYPIYEEVEGPLYPSFSLKYTLKDNYLVKKGRASNSRFYRNKKNGSPFKQYQVHANLLSTSSDYSGLDYSAGDKYIKDKSDLSSDKTGGHKQWIQASLNHHISLTIKQIENETSVS